MNIYELIQIYELINKRISDELTRNEIASLILGVLDAEMCRAKYKYKRRKLLLVTRVSRSRRSSD